MPEIKYFDLCSVNKSRYKGFVTKRLFILIPKDDHWIERSQRKKKKTIVPCLFLHNEADSHMS